jgi:N-acetylglucosaminyldiphosphoundecaprenol N-acetyl-beta-D-mannosaminyltransferase
MASQSTLTGMGRAQLLGVPIDGVTMTQAVDRLHGFARGSSQHRVVTINSEMLVESVVNSAFRRCIASADFLPPDSAGVVWMSRLTGQWLPSRVAGVDIVTRFCASATEEETVFLLGAGHGIAERAAANLRAHNPNLKIVGTFSGTPKPEHAYEAMELVKEAKPRVLFVAFGAPAQELWIEKYLTMLPTVRVAMGVGGTFDFLAGVQRRAPWIFRILGCEWLWRLLRQPSRFPRIINAVTVFPRLVLRYGKREPSTR